MGISSRQSTDCHVRRAWKASLVLISLAGAYDHSVVRGEDETASSTSSSTANIDDGDSSSPPGDCAAPSAGDAPSSGRILQSLFRFDASRLGPEFDELLWNWYSGWLRVPISNGTTTTTTTSADPPPIVPEPACARHAYHSVSTPAATLFRRQCYGPAPRTTPHLRNLYDNFEQRRKEIAFEYGGDGAEEMRLMHAMARRFYPAFRGRGGGSNDPPEDGRPGYRGTSGVHEKKSKSTANTVYAGGGSTPPSDCDMPSSLSFQTRNVVGDDDDEDRRVQEWSWYPPGHFSDRGISGNVDFRKKMYETMRRGLQGDMHRSVPDFDRFEYGRQSGMFWYPPGGVREWHTNRLDLVGNARGKGGGKREEAIFATQVWRMYFVRTARDPDFDGKLSKLRKGGAVDDGRNDHSAMHIIPGDDGGITLEVLRRAGARPLSRSEEMRQWRDEFAEGETIPPPEGHHEMVIMENDTALDRNAVWRIPDQDGFVTLFRLPDIWHCIVSEEVHRYSLGFAFSDKEVQALLKLADVEFDVANGNENTCGD